MLRGCGRAWRGDALPGEVAVWGDVEAVRRRLVVGSGVVCFLWVLRGRECMATDVSRG